MPLAENGERQPHAPHSPSLGVSKHRPYVKKSSIWSSKKSPIWGMCSSPLRYYNLINRQAGRPSSPSEDQPGFSLGIGPVLCSRCQPSIRSELRPRDVFARVASRELGPRPRRGETSLEPSLLYGARWPLCVGISGWGRLMCSVGSAPCSSYERDIISIGT
jgi:hypothetical protein